MAAPKTTTFTPGNYQPGVPPPGRPPLGPPPGRPPLGPPPGWKPKVLPKPVFGKDGKVVDPQGQLRKFLANMANIPPPPQPVLEQADSQMGRDVVKVPPKVAAKPGAKAAAKVPPPLPAKPAPKPAPQKAATKSDPGPQTPVGGDQLRATIMAQLAAAQQGAPQTGTPETATKSAVSAPADFRHVQSWTAEDAAARLKDAEAASTKKKPKWGRFGKKSGPKKETIDRSMISGPTAFQHVASIAVGEGATQAPPPSFLPARSASDQ